MCDYQPYKWEAKDLEALILVLRYAESHNKGLSITGDSSWTEIEVLR